MYERPARMLGNCAASVVPLPSSKSHVPEHVPPTPVAKAVQSLCGFKPAPGELLSLKGLPKKPQTTGNVGAAAPPAWMCAGTKLSFGPGVLPPRKSMLKTVAVKLNAVPASLRKKSAVPNDNGLGSPRPNP